MRKADIKSIIVKKFRPTPNVKTFYKETYYQKDFDEKNNKNILDKIISF